MKYLSFLLLLFFGLHSCVGTSVEKRREVPQSGASLSLDAWALSRSYPNKTIAVDQISKAFDDKKSTAVDRNSTANWEGIGPMNIAGRTLALAFHPLDPNIIFLGSASGGLWKTTTAGLGVHAWERVNLGFPVLAVSCIAISPTNPDLIYIGTGEMYNSTESRPGTVNRLTRGTYGFGIFKSVDGGNNWERSLDWSYQEMRGVQDLLINPQNEKVLYTATSVGLLKTTNAGESWNTIHELPMAVDVELNPVDTNFLYVSHGSLFHQEYSGIYRSKNGGDSFTKLRIGLPDDYTGKAVLSLDPHSDKTVYASIADAFQSKGLYRTSNHGDSWTQVNREDIAMFQGWYSHDVAVNPNNARDIIQVGIDAWRSTNSGFTMEQQTSWTNARNGQNPVGQNDGPPNYVHSDIHQAIFHPLMENTVFLATDGGVFVSKDGGTTYESRNGSLQTTQFYANFANAATDGDLAIGGMQDNATAIYTGDPAWTKVLGGDGMSAALDPMNDNILYASSQFLNIFRSIDGGRNFVDIAPGAIEPTFSAPFELAPSNPRVLYAGGRLLYKSTDRGNNWQTPQGTFLDEGNSILNITVAPYNLNRLMVSTAPNATDKANIFWSENGGSSWRKLNGLPNRLATDLAFHPTDESVAFITFGGFGSFHVYQTMDNGMNWFPIDNNLPDIPHNTIIIDVERPDNIYLGNDLGVYVSEDGGGIWSPFMTGLPEAVLAIDLSISSANQKLRVATHGNGVYQTDLIGKVVSSVTEKVTINFAELGQNFHNPVVRQTVIPVSLSQNSQIALVIYDFQGRMLQTIANQQLSVGDHQVTTNLHHLPTGNYVYQLTGTTKGGQPFKMAKRLQKK
ncbi:MAG: T9SS type A sorting domain-containing protein [Bacteroidota bacterium]